MKTWRHWVWGAAMLGAANCGGVARVRDSEQIELPLDSAGADAVEGIQDMALLRADLSAGGVMVAEGEAVTVEQSESVGEGVSASHIAVTLPSEVAEVVHQALDAGGEVRVVVYATVGEQSVALAEAEVGATSEGTLVGGSIPPAPDGGGEYSGEFGGTVGTNDPALAEGVQTVQQVAAGSRVRPELVLSSELSHFAVLHNSRTDQPAAEWEVIGGHRDFTVRGKGGLRIPVALGVSQPWLQVRAGWSQTPDRVDLDLVPSGLAGPGSQTARVSFAIEVGGAAEEYTHLVVVDVWETGEEGTVAGNSSADALPRGTLSRSGISGGPTVSDGVRRAEP
ncbi:MAG: hypothetical protein HYY13_11575 [Nitrospirae bacterium]|nr:hypothetical protein [Nitrospirota bacterium]